LVGPTGSGKTTIFRLLIREMLPTQGTIVIDSWDIVKLPNKKVADLRKKIGVIFQDLKLLHDRTILENTTLPLDISGVKSKEAIKIAEEILTKVGAIEQKDKFPLQLSGGELQRAAIARSLILSPDIILADEPTGNLDEKSSWEIVKLLSDINEAGTTVIMATHSIDIVKKMGKRMIELNLGSVVNDKKGSGKTNEKESSKEEKAEKEKHQKTHTTKDMKNTEEKKGKEEKLKTEDFEKALKE